MHGNISTLGQLDFTVIRSVVNVTSRIESKSKALNRNILLSAEFARDSPCRLVSLGIHTLGGVSTSQELFTLTLAPASRCWRGDSRGTH